MTKRLSNRRIISFGTLAFLTLVGLLQMASSAHTLAMTPTPTWNVREIRQTVEATLTQSADEEDEVQLLNERLLRDTSLIDGIPCGAPCWRGITPGVTFWNDALDLIEADKTLDALSTRSDDSSSAIGATWAQSNGDHCCQMFTQDGYTVSLVVFRTAPQLRFDQVLEKYGKPAFLLGEVVSDDQALISVYYPDVPMLVYLFVKGRYGRLDSNSFVVGFAYTTSELMEIVIETSNLYRYEGFGTFFELVDESYALTPSVTLTPHLR